MTPDEIRRWHNAREATFAVSLPSRTIAEITVALEPLELARGLAALESYRGEKPYKGFYWLRYMVHYHRAKSVETDGADASLRAAALPTQREDSNIDSDRDIRREREMFDALAPSFVALCETLFADWGIRGRDARAWRILCIDHAAGVDVTPYRRYSTLKLIDDDRVERIHNVAKRADTIMANENAALRSENRTLRVNLADALAAVESACRIGATIDVLA